MPIIADCHVHSLHSGDSSTDVEEMILQCIHKGLKIICFTEHNDFNFPITQLDPEGKFECDMNTYYSDMQKYRKMYTNKIKILFGIELGLQPSVLNENILFAKSHDFDFIIGSSHLCDGIDPSCPEFYVGRDVEEAYREYFNSILNNIKLFPNFDVYGHLDYVVRYGPNADAEYSYEKYQDIIDKILKTLIEKGKGIEINTGGLNKGMRDVHPCTGIIKRYRELGGEIITIGSDAHVSKNIATHFERAENILRECGFKYYTIFENREPKFITL